ncbi:MAG TPA: hypothetical protein VFZ83_08070 [Acidimicrobiia bacterium]|nr:hypothetical protein [Acidimicrobiia bacterium]
MVGAVLILVVMFVVGPVALFVGGALWSLVFGQLETWTNADDAGVAPEGS